MSSLQQNIKRITDKLQRVLKLHQQLQKDNERQTKIIKELQETKEKNTLTIAELQQQADILKASAGQMAARDKKAFEKHINNYIKEIDKCIGLLSE
jgi:hypothetical protein